MGIIKNYKDKFKKKFELLENENRILSGQVIDLRIKYKVISNQKINIVFVCHRPSVWGANKTIYDFFDKNKDKCNVKIVTIPQINNGKFIDEGADEFFKEYNMVKGFNKVTSEFIDLKLLEPDYIFFQQPYNGIYPQEYRSNVVSKYAKICYVSYFNYLGNKTNNITSDECYPIDYLKDVSLMFSQNDDENRYLHNRLSGVQNKLTHIYQTGYPKYDDLNEYVDSESSSWNYKKTENHFRVLWTPRWTTNENNCGFFKYKDCLLEYCNDNEKVDFVFRPHPQSWVEWDKTGELKAEDAEIYKRKYDKIKNASIDKNKSYLETFYSSDCLVSDISSIIPDYILTGKPLIYCTDDNATNKFNRRGGYSEAMYWVKNWKELKDTLDMLIKGEDPLRDKRLAIVKDYFKIEDKSGNRIGKVIMEDAGI